MLGDKHLRTEPAYQRKGDGMQSAQPTVVTGAGRERNVDGEPLRAGAADLVRKAGAGKQCAAGLVLADRQHARVVPERSLHTVAVVHVDVDVGDALNALFE